jgi:circadian clock protein KaiC
MTLSDSVANGITKSATGISGFDGMTSGGIPTGCTTLISGEAGAGKTVFALQTLVGGARDQGEPGIFVAFEEHSQRIIANAAQFGWNLKDLQQQGLLLLDAQPDPQLIQSGEFGLEGMLSRIDAKIKEMGARRVVFDAIDVILSLMDDPRKSHQEMYRLNDWLVRRGLTAVITSKSGKTAEDSAIVRLDYMQFMADCFIQLRHDCESGISHRSLRIVKLRGSAFEENETPLVIGRSGIQVAYTRELEKSTVAVSNELISSGVERLDTMLGGGFLRASGILITGAPGTAKTSLGGAFAQAACKRGENTLMVSFDSPPKEVIRNLASINIDLNTPYQDGTLEILAAHSIHRNPEHHFLRICQAAEARDVRCLIVDPLSALASGGRSGWSKSIVERLIDWCKSRGITVLCTSLLDQKSPDTESTPMQISTIADTWIHLNYQIHGGERNRGLTIVKSRGIGHSNQVREIVLSDNGITLEDVYSSGGEVLMGTLRYERESTDAMERKLRDAQTIRHRLELENEAAELKTRLQSLERELAFKQAQIDQSQERTETDDSDRDSLLEGRLKKRGADSNRRTKSSDD